MIKSLIWELPQIIVGFIVMLVTGATKSEDGNYYYWKYGSGLSLSQYFIFVNENASENTKLHETLRD